MKIRNLFILHGVIAIGYALAFSWHRAHSSPIMALPPAWKGFSCPDFSAWDCLASA